MPDETYNAGGLSWNGDSSPFQGVSDSLGRIWNNLSGTTANNQFSASEAEKARVFNSAEAQKNRDWQEYMSNTAYQRQIKDMQAAGINPATVGGTGASTPSGSAASAAAAQATASGGHGGFVGLIARAAMLATGKALAAKFSNSAMKAADNHELVAAKIKHMAAQEAQASARAQREASAEMRKAAESSAKRRWYTASASSKASNIDFDEFTGAYDWLKNNSF